MADQKFLVLKRGFRGNGERFVNVDSNFYDKLEDANILLRARRRMNAEAKCLHEYAIAILELPADEEFA